jgi:hypothetical protein
VPFLPSPGLSQKPLVNNKYGHLIAVLFTQYFSSSGSLVLF